MQFRILPAMLIFLGSYLPLSVILLAQNFDDSLLGHAWCARFWSSGCAVPLKNPLFSFGFLLVTLVCFGMSLLVLTLVRPSQDIQVEEAKAIPTDLMNYTLPYVVSFMGLDYQDGGKFFGFAVFLTWMFWISYKSGQIILNPLLIAMSWRLYEIKYRFSGSTDSHYTYALANGYISQGAYKQWPLQDIQIIKP